MVCCILPFDKSLMFKVKTTTFGYFTSIHQILENSTIFEIYIFISRMIQSVRLQKNPIFNDWLIFSEKLLV